jgi:CBS domain-containing protein
MRHTTETPPAREISNDMQLKEIMTTDVEVITPESSVTEAAKKMRSLDVGALPVCDGRRLVGMVTDRDITIRATAEARDPDSTLVRDCMSPELVYCFEDQDIQEAERLMQQKQIRRLPVLTREKQLAGIISLGDLATKTGDVQQVGRTTREVSEPAKKGTNR